MNRFRPSSFPLKLACFLCLLLVMLPFSAQAQRRGGRGGGGFGGFGGRFGGGFGGYGGYGGSNPANRYGQGPAWDIDPAFKEDLFTFARLIYPSWNGYDGGGNWLTDVPDADWNLSLRLHQVTSLKVRPGLNFIEITPRTLAKYPFVYIVEPGRMMLTNEQVVALRQYLLNGGFLMVDDFWGSGQWQNFYEQMKRVFPTRELKELSFEHPIFHSVFDLKEKPQMPAIEIFMNLGITWEPRWDYSYESHDSHFYGLFDDKGRMMVFVSHNNDFGDGWEREGEDPTYFHNFSEKQAYPMFINILFYATTH